MCALVPGLSVPVIKEKFQEAEENNKKIGISLRYTNIVTINKK